MRFLWKLFCRDAHCKAVAEITDNLKLLAECEREMAEIYKLCAVKYPEEKDMWEELAESELRHERNIGRMEELMKASPDDYYPGESFNPASIRTFHFHVSDVRERLEKEEMPREKLLGIIDELENSVFEMSYVNIVTTKNKEFNHLADEIDRETESHRESIRKLMA